MENKEKYYTKGEVIETLNISLAKIDRAIRDNELGYIRIGKRTIRIPESELNKWVRHIPANNNKQAEEQK